MKGSLLATCLLCLAFAVPAQVLIAFTSDTQAPMKAEKVVLKSNQNERATGLIFHDLLKVKPAALFILGDVVNLGYKEKKWLVMDKYIDSCRRAGIRVSAVLGNHDVMTKARKGEHVFQERFPDHVRLGSYQIVDSVAIMLLNSNFRKLSSQDIQTQRIWFSSTLKNLDNDPSVLMTIVTCHHAPYSNSKIVGSSRAVQLNFVPDYIQSSKAILFITGHSHNYEHFAMQGKDFLVIGGGGGLSQPRNSTYTDVSQDYKPAFHYILGHREKKELVVLSRYLKNDFSGFDDGLIFKVKIK